MSTNIKNKLSGRAKSAGLGSIMRPGVILALVLISVFSFGALLTLSGFAGDLRGDSNGRAHALSDSAIGYGGIVELMRGDDMEVTLSREALDNKKGDVFRVITLSAPYQMPARSDIRDDEATLIVLPKWYVFAIQEKPGWVRQAPEPIGPTFKPDAYETPLKDYFDTFTVSQVVDDDGTLTYDLTSNKPDIPSGERFNIRHLQSLEGDNLIRILTANDKVVLGQIAGTSVFILSEPDLLNTMGMSLKTRAKFGRDLLDGLVIMNASELNHVEFDLSVHGFGRTQNLIKTLLTPPFLAATLCLLAAGALIGWQAFARFGDPVLEERDYALGKYTLADNGARFIRIARKETGMADGYRDLMRRLAARDFYMDKQSQDDIEKFLEGREAKLGMTARWKILASNLKSATDKDSFLQAAQAIYKWRQEITHEHK